MKLEVIPEVLKRGVMVLVYKAGGKDPLCIDSYLGITLTSMVTKVLDFCYLIGLSKSSSMQVCHTSISQHTDREAHDCADAILTTQEVISRYWYMKGGSKVYVPI